AAGAAVRTAVAANLRLHLLDAARHVAELLILLGDLLVIVERLAIILQPLIRRAELEVERQLLALGDALDVQRLLELADGLGLLALLGEAEADHGVTDDLFAG